MEAQIAQLISKTYTRYQQYGYHRSGFYDITMSIVSWLALPYRQQNKNGSVPNKLPLLFSEITSGFDQKKMIQALKDWENYEGKAWKGLLVLDVSLVERIPDEYWQFILPAWNDLFAQANTNGQRVVLNVFDQLEQVMTADQQGGDMFLTPKALTGIMAHYLASDKKGVLYDPFARTGNLLTDALQQLPNVTNVTGFSPNNMGWKLAKLRLLFTSEKLKLAIQKEHYHEREAEKYDFIVSNPPFGQMAYNEPLTNISDDWSGLVLKSKRQEVYHFCHILSHLADNGRACVLLPGIFLSGSLIIKQLIRRLLEQNILDAVIALPAGLFVHTGISTVLIGINKNRKKSDRVLLADASAEVEKSGRQHILKTENIENWMGCLRSQSDKANDQFMVMATAEEIAARDYNLYVAAYRQKQGLINERKPSAELKSEYENLEDQIATARAELITFLSKKQ